MATKAKASKEEQERIAEAAAVSPEERKRRWDAYQEQMRRDLAAEADAGPAIPVARPAEEEATPLAELLARCQAIAVDREAERMALPCYRAMYPDGVEPEDPGARVADHIGAAACNEVEAWRECERAMTGFGCPRARALLTYDRVRQNLAAARVPKDDYELVLRHAAGRARLYPTDPMLLMAAVRRAAAVHRRAAHAAHVTAGIGGAVTAGMEVKFKAASEKLIGDRDRKNAAWVRGDERIVLMGGNKGRGKTTAAVYALAYGPGGAEDGGGLYTTEYAFTRPKNAGGQDIIEAKKARVLVIDQFGRGHLGESGYALAAIEEVVDARKADRLMTILVGNFDWNTAFLERYDSLVASRIVGYGVVVMFRGPDMREKLREQPEASP